MKHVLTFIFVGFLFGRSGGLAGIISSEGTPREQSDSAAIYDLVKKLQGIEFYFVFDQDFDRMGTNLKMLLEYRQLPIPPLLQKYKSDFTIAYIDANYRSMTLTCGQCEITQRLVYWRVSDGSVLVATVFKDCSHCSEDISFTTHKDGVISSLEREAVLPVVHLSDYLINPADSSFTKGLVFGFTYNLSTDGDNISICLDLMERDENRTFLSDCIEFIWEDGKFVRHGF
jgi:hypothetical protein